MKSLLLTIYRFFESLGFNPILAYNGLINLGFYFKDYIKIKKYLKNKDFKLLLNYPCLHDRFDNGGTAKGHYFHQDLLIARKIFKANPKKHVDIGSRVDGFIAHLATFREVEIFDIRHIESKTSGIHFKKANLMELDNKYLDYTDSISCLHAIEHFGLGRYGDPIDIEGHIKGLNNIYKILKKGGVFYFSVPIGLPQRIEFNAHRVFGLEYLTNIFKGKYEIKSFSYVDDKGDLFEDVNILEGIKDSFNCKYGCGIFELIKQ